MPPPQGLPLLPQPSKPFTQGSLSHSHSLFLSLLPTFSLIPKSYLLSLATTAVYSHTATATAAASPLARSQRTVRSRLATTTSTSLPSALAAAAFAPPASPPISGPPSPSVSSPSPPFPPTPPVVSAARKFLVYMRVCMCARTQPFGFMS